jgi:DNA-binding FadR family transcriptional regulator
MLPAVTTPHEVSGQWAQTTFVLYPESPIPLFAQLARSIRARIAAWDLPSGSLLPSEPQLAKRHNLSRDTVGKAYRLLRDAGAIKSRRGSGWFVTDPIPLTYLTIPPGSQVYARPVRPTDVDAIGDMRVMLMESALIVEEPGKPPVAYDAMRTVVRVPA